MKVTDMPIIVGVLWKVLKSYAKKLGEVEEAKWSKIEYRGECERIKKKTCYHLISTEINQLLLV